MSNYAERRSIDKRIARGEDVRPPSKRDQTRENLLQIASKLFMSRDFEALSIDKICKEAGISRSLFYLYFSNKSDLLANIVQKELQRLNTHYRWFSDKEPTADNIREFLEVGIKKSRREKKKIALLYHAQTFHADVMRASSQNRQQRIDALGETISAFRSGGRSDDVERERQARATLLFYEKDALNVNATLLPDEVDLEASLAALTKNFVDFITMFALPVETNMETKIAKTPRWRWNRK